LSETDARGSSGISPLALAFISSLISVALKNNQIQSIAYQEVNFKTILKSNVSS